MFAKFLVLATGILMAVTTQAAEPRVTFSDMVAYETPGNVGIAYFTATSTKDDAIVGVSSDCCKAVELHRNEKINGMMTMRRIAELSLENDEPVKVQPDAARGEHLMLIGLKEPLKEGDTLRVTFRFKKAPAELVTFPVKPRPGNTGAKDNHESGHEHHE